MGVKIKNGIFVGVCLLIIILLFTIVDHFIHGLEDIWGVPDYYFINKIPFGFLWGIIGLLIARKFRNIWMKALIVATLISVALQLRYFVEGYPLSFVLLFLVFHFLILYFLSSIMYKIFSKEAIS